MYNSMVVVQYNGRCFLLLHLLHTGRRSLNGLDTRTSKMWSILRNRCRRRRHDEPIQSALISIMKKLVYFFVPNFTLSIKACEHGTPTVQNLGCGTGSRCIGIGWSVASVTSCVRPRSKRKTTWAANTKLGRHTVHCSRSACIDPRGQKVEGQGHAVIKCAADVGMQVDMTALFLVVFMCSPGCMRSTLWQRAAVHRRQMSAGVTMAMADHHQTINRSLYSSSQEAGLVYQIKHVYIYNDSNWAHSMGP